MQRGFVLLIALVLILISGSLVTHYMAAMQVEFDISQNLIQQQQLGEYAEAGIVAAQALLSFDDPSIDHLGEEWASSPEEPLVLPLDDTEELGEDSMGVLVSLVITDENRKLNLNGLALPDAGNPTRDQPFHVMLRRLLEHLQLPLKIEDEAIDWIDSDDLPQPQGAETAAYRALDRGYLAKNRTFDHVTEILLLPSVEPEWFHRGVPNEAALPLKRLLTVLPVDARGKETFQVNLNTAPPDILLSLHSQMTRALVREIVRVREEEGGIASDGELQELIPDLQPLLTDVSEPLPEWTSYSSNWFLVESIADLDGIAVQRTALLERSGGTPTILWMR